MTSLTEHPSTFTFVASTGNEDRTGDIIDQKGWDLDNYRKNPVVLFAHQWHIPPVGKALDTRIERERLIITMQYAETPLAQELALLTADGYIRCVSVGFRPIEWEMRRDKKGYTTGTHFHHQELLEVSIVNLPANADALRKALIASGPPIDAITTFRDQGIIWTSAPITETPTAETLLKIIQGMRRELHDHR